MILSLVIVEYLVQVTIIIMPIWVMIKRSQSFKIKIGKIAHFLVEIKIYLEKEARTPLLWTLRNIWGKLVRGIEVTNMNLWINSYLRIKLMEMMDYAKIVTCHRNKRDHIWRDHNSIEQVYLMMLSQLTQIWWD